jgi:flavin reductase (DIM6/NTAB) family NADH-FMN oxidoreductase RutF
VVVGVKADSGTYKTVKAARAFALNMLGKEQKNLAFTFFRPVDVSDGKLSGQPFRKGETGAPILVDAPGAVECRVTAIVEQGGSPHHRRRSRRGASQQTAHWQTGRRNP